MNIPLQLKLETLKKTGILKDYNFLSQIQSCEEMDDSRLIDKLYLTFPNGETLNLTTFCSGYLQNTTIELNDES